MLRGEPLGPQPLATLTAERVVVHVALRLQADDVPALAVPRRDPAALTIPVLREDAAGDVVLVPPGLDDDNGAVFINFCPNSRYVDHFSKSFTCSCVVAGVFVCLMGPNALNKKAVFCLSALRLPYESRRFAPDLCPIKCVC